MALRLIRPANKEPGRLYMAKAVPGVSTIPHNGNDYGWGNGKQIYAAAAGRVSFIRWSAETLTNNRHGGYGNYLIIDHGDGYATLYAHLPTSAMLVVLGQEVTQGALIAWMGDTGNAAGVHLHFEVRYRGSIVDPNQFFGSSATSGSATDQTPIKIVSFLMALTDNEQKELLDLTRSIAGYLFKGGESVTAGKPGIDFDVRSVLGRINAIGEATFSGGTSMVDGGKSIAVSLSEINANVTAVAERVPGTGSDIDYAALAKAVNDEQDKRERERLA